ncbi:MAG: histone deacetylase [Candidatus Hadarchaeales archaeon]
MTAILYSQEFLRHRPGKAHPESPRRLRAIVDNLKKEGTWYSPKVRVIHPSPCREEDLLLVHEPSYLQLLERMGEREMELDEDTPVKEETGRIARLAVGAALEAGRGVMEGRWRNALALLRPPGHHAGRGSGGGFCYLNNVAVMVERMRKDFGVRRALILDLDAHHGNGTQEIFYRDPGVLFLSLHQDPRTLYPWRGFVHELGEGEGEGFSVNVPLPPGSGEGEYACAMEEVFLPLVGEFRPELVAVSLGLDPLKEDPLTQLELLPSSYAWLTGMVLEGARGCGARVAMVLEGGYAPSSVGRAMAEVVKVLVEGKGPPPPPPSEVKAVAELKGLLRRYWRL